MLVTNTLDDGLLPQGYVIYLRRVLLNTNLLRNTAYKQYKCIDISISMYFSVDLLWLI